MPTTRRKPRTFYAEMLTPLERRVLSKIRRHPKLMQNIATAREGDAIYIPRPSALRLPKRGPGA